MEEIEILYSAIAGLTALAVGLGTYTFYRFRRENPLKTTVDVPSFSFSNKDTKVNIKKKKPKTVKKPDIDPEKAYVMLKDFNILKTRRKKNLKLLKDWWNNRRHPDKIAMIHIELNNGFHKSFLIKEKEDSFLYKKKTYVIDPEAKYYNIDAKIWCYDYHENFALPIKRKIPIKDIRDVMKSINLNEIEYATNPSTLEKFISSEIAKQVLKSAQLDDWMRRMLTMTLLILVIVTGIGIYILYATGAFANIQNIV